MEQGRRAPLDLRRLGEDGTGQRPKCSGLERVRGASCRTRSQDLGHAVGAPRLREAVSDKVSEKHQILFQRIPGCRTCSQYRSSWSIVQGPGATTHSDALIQRKWKHLQEGMTGTCLRACVRSSKSAQTKLTPRTRDSATLPMSLGLLDLRSTVRTSKAVHWASWADWHPQVANIMMEQLDCPQTRCFAAVSSAWRDLEGVGGFAPPSWGEVAMGARPEFRELVDLEPGDMRDGWQHEAASRFEESFRETNLFPRMGDARKALVRSQGGSGAGLALSTCPVNRLTTSTPQVFRVILLRRPHLPLTLTVRNCRCGQPLDICGHHRAACAPAGVLGGRGWALENVVARICSEAGGRVTTNVLVRNLDLVGPDVEVVAGCLCSEVPNWRSTRQWSVHCVLTAPPGGGQRPTEWRQQRLDAGNAGLTPSWSARKGAPRGPGGSWRPMVARKKRRFFCHSWPKQRPGAKPS